jgi:hypothetical protein
MSTKTQKSLTTSSLLKSLLSLIFVVGFFILASNAFGQSGSLQTAQGISNASGGFGMGGGRLIQSATPRSVGIGGISIKIDSPVILGDGQDVLIIRPAEDGTIRPTTPGTRTTTNPDGGTIIRTNDPGGPGTIGLGGGGSAGAGDGRGGDGELGTIISNHGGSFSGQILAPIVGYAWMGVNIIPFFDFVQGGGGWINFNCIPDYCADPDPTVQAVATQIRIPDQPVLEVETPVDPFEPPVFGGETPVGTSGSPFWGTFIDINENSPTYGMLFGHAWSNNYGYMSFEDYDTSSCFNKGFSGVSDGRAMANLGGSGNNATINGWGKFLAGTADGVSGGWDGCFSFNGPLYDVKINKTTGKLSGWAWGGVVGGWLGFNCEDCDAKVIFPVLGCTDPSASNYNSEATQEDGSCDDGDPSEIVWGCTNPLALNYNPGATNDDGSCDDGDPSEIVWGCTNPLALNYNPGATNDDGSCIQEVNLSVDVVPQVFIVGSGNYIAESVSWYTTSNSIVGGSCVGSLTFDGVTQNLSGWTGPVSDPGTPQSQTTLGGFDLAQWANGATSGQQFRFIVICDTTSGGQVSDSGVITMANSPTPPVEPSTLSLQITEPDENSGPFYEILSPFGGDVTINWGGENINWDTCYRESGKNGNYNNWNDDWVGSAPYEPSSHVVNMAGNNAVATGFRLTCDGLNNGQTLIRTVNVCVAGLECPFTPPGGGFPTYEEF